MKTTCKNCKFLQHSKAKKSEIIVDGELVSYSSEARNVIDIMAEYYCPWMWFNMKPVGEVCEHWEFKNGKNWL